MKTTISSQAGYCRGVMNAVRCADLCIGRGLSQGRAFYTIGSLIHNPAVVAEYEARGLRSICSPTDAVPGVALVRAHGIPDAERAEFEEAGFELVDGTCPVILATRRAMLEASEKGRTVVLVGTAGHAETRYLEGILTPAGEPAASISVHNPCGVSAIPAGIPISVAVQTTFPAPEYGAIVDAVRARSSDVELLNGLCPVCSDRMAKAVAELSKADCAVVVGSSTSGNTTNLVNALRSTGKPVFTVGSPSEVDDGLRDSVCGYGEVVLFSGTSTPIEHIRAVAKALSSVE